LRGVKRRSNLLYNFVIASYPEASGDEATPCFILLLRVPKFRDKAIPLNEL